jgi:hypothetical protein
MIIGNTRGIFEDILFYIQNINVNYLHLYLYMCYFQFVVK